MAPAHKSIAHARYGAVLFTIGVVVATGAANGQGLSSGGDSELQDARDVFDEIIVTAQKREQPLHRVPASVSVFSGDVVEKAVIKNVADLGLYTPSMVVSTNGTSGRIYIRGVGNNLDFLGSQGAVAVHVDGVYQSRQWGVFYDFIDIERIEVLRGPQGTLYGRNATGGVINVISASPTEELEATATLSIGNFDEVRLVASASSVLTDRTTGRLAVSSKTRDGFTENRFPDARNPGDEDLVSARAELQISPSEIVDIRLLGRYFVRDAQGPAIVPTVDGLAASLGARSNTDPFVVRHNTDIFFEAENFGLTGIVTLHLNNGIVLESITGFSDNEVDYHLDTDGTEIDAVHFQNREDHAQFSQEFRLNRDSSDRRWVWQAGLFYLREDTTDSGVVFLPAFGFDVPVSGKIDVDAFAAYAQGTYRIAENLGLTIGLRYNNESKAMTSAAFGNDKASWTDWTPHVSLEYEWSSNTLIYASIAKGFKSGGFNVLVDGEQVGPEFVWNFEVGSKAQWSDRRIGLNTAAFYSRYDDQQVNTFTGAGLARIDNAARSTIYGIELEAFAAPTEETRAGVTVSYLDARFDEYLAADPFLGPVDLAGSRLSHAPRFAITVSGDYQKPLKSRASIAAHVDFLWQDDVKYDVFDNPATNQESFGIVNAGIWYTGARGNWRTGLWIRNLTDEVYFTSHVKLNFSPDGVVSWTGEPRTYGIEFVFDY